MMFPKGQLSRCLLFECAGFHYTFLVMLAYCASCILKDKPALTLITVFNLVFRAVVDKESVPELELIYRYSSKITSGCCSVKIVLV